MPFQARPPPPPSHFNRALKRGFAQVLKVYKMLLLQVTKTFQDKDKRRGFREARSTLLAHHDAAAALYIGSWCLKTQELANFGLNRGVTQRLLKHMPKLSSDMTAVSGRLPQDARIARSRPTRWADATGSSFRQATNR
eukprot:365362-Chlamydomonas_euryale.AAC.17